MLCFYCELDVPIPGTFEFTARRRKPDIMEILKPQAGRVDIKRTRQDLLYHITLTFLQSTADHSP